MIFENGSYIKLDENRCLNLMHNGVECSHCIGHCPTEAIVYYGNRITLLRDECTGCGVCLSDCPTGVFQSSQWDETQIIRDIEKKEWKVTEFFCARHSLPYKIDQSEEQGAVQLPACLSALSRGAWFEVCLKTEIEIHLDQCEECPMAKTITRLEHNVSTAAEWLEATGNKSSITYIHQSPQGKVKKRFMAIGTGLKVTSRRDLFVSLIKNGKRLQSNEPDKENETTSIIQKNLRNGYLSEWQKRLAEVFPQNVKDVSNPAYWPTIEINEQCVNCGMCANFCPSGALQTIEEEGVCNRYFTSGRCLDCRICQLFCPRGAISRDRQKVERPFDDKKIHSAPSTKCKRCHSVTVTNGDDLCYWCKQETCVENGLMDSLMKIFG